MLLRHNEVDLAAPLAALAIRQTEDTDFILQESTKAITELPNKIKKVILVGDTRIIIAPTILEYLPYLSNSCPDGYPKGQNWDFVPGYFDGSNIIIPERIKSSEGVMVLNKNAYYSTMHEMGHAFDAHNGNLAWSEQFKYCYKLDCESLSVDATKRYSYFLQPDGHGRCELFAGLFELYVSRLMGRKERLAKLSLAFPRCYDFVFRKLE